MLNTDKLRLRFKEQLITLNGWSQSKRSFPILTVSNYYFLLTLTRFVIFMKKKYNHRAKGLSCLGLI